MKILFCFILHIAGISPKTFASIFLGAFVISFIMSAIIFKKLNLSCLVRAQSRALCTPVIPRNILEDKMSAQNQTKPGFVYDKKPFRISLYKGEYN